MKAVDDTIQHSMKRKKLHLNVITRFFGSKDYYSEFDPTHVIFI